MARAFLLTCACGANNRFVMGQRVRCGKCRHEFTPAELTKARPEQPTPQAREDYDDEDEEFDWEGEQD